MAGWYIKVHEEFAVFNLTLTLNLNPKPQMVVFIFCPIPFKTPTLAPISTTLRFFLANLVCPMNPQLCHNLRYGNLQKSPSATEAWTNIGVSVFSETTQCGPKGLNHKAYTLNPKP